MDVPVTMKCNNDCISCIFDTRQMRLMRDSPPASLLNYMKNNMDDEPIGFTGGEPTLSKDFFKLLKETRKTWPEKYIFLVSNGRKFCNIDFSKKLASLQLGNFRVGVPIFSHRPEMHDLHTAVKGSFDETIAGIQNLVKQGISVELRLLVTKLNYLELRETAGFIAENLQGIFRVVFINLKYTGNAFIHREKLFVRYSKLTPYVQKAVDSLVERDFYVRLFHFPLCTIDQQYWEFADGISKQEEELQLLKKCSMCRVKEACPRIWISYLPLAGETEFKPILKI